MAADRRELLAGIAASGFAIGFTNISRGENGAVKDRKTGWKLDYEAAIAELPTGREPRHLPAVRRGDMHTLLYAPRGSDPQSPHSQDELYIVISGSGNFRVGERTSPFTPGDMLFVPAGAVHRFEDFSDDFAAWVVFYGPEGGDDAPNEGLGAGFAHVIE